MTSRIPTVEYSVHALDLQWEDVLWAVRKGLWGWRDIKAFAMFRLSNFESPYFEIENEICGLDKNEASKIMDLAEGTANGPVMTESVSRKWQYLELKWIFDKIDEIDSPFGWVEEIYADFGYPEDMESFVPFLPPTDGWEPQQHSEAENRARLLKNWLLYLDSAEKNLVAGRK